MNGKPLESDWKAFRVLVPMWRDRYLAARIPEIVALLTDAETSEATRFWVAEERMKEVARTLTSCLDGHSRSKLDYYLYLLCKNGFVREEDLASFSEATRASYLKDLQDR